MSTLRVAETEASEDAYRAVQLLVARQALHEIDP